MDKRRFDDLSRSLASGTSRRTLLRGMVGGSASLIGLRVATAVAGPPARVDVCHFDTASGTYRQISVPERALAAHLAHGDVLGSECETLTRCAGKVQEDQCGPGEYDICATNQDNGQLVCVDSTTLGGFCISSACPAGQVCVIDDPTAPAHCHPPL